MSGPRSYELYMTQGPSPGTTFPLFDRSMTIGRDPMSDILINNPEVSRQHALLFSTAEGEFRLQDLGSTNGTYVNGRRLGSKPDLLRPFSTILLGGAVTLIFRESSTVPNVQPDSPVETSQQEDALVAASDAAIQQASQNDVQPAAAEQAEIPDSSELPLREPEMAKIKAEQQRGKPPSTHLTSGSSGSIPQPAQIQPAKSEELSPNLILGLVLLLLCGCATILVFLVYLRGDWLLRQIGIVP